MKILYIFLIGIVILLSALLLNYLATRFGVMTWYDYIKNPKNATAIEYIWLYIIYPFLLGVVAYYTAKILPL